MSSYKEKFDELMLRVQMTEEHFHIIWRFIHGSKEEIRRAVEMSTPSSID